MITIFSIPKAFKDNISIIQINAILSWKQIDPNVQIVLYGDEIGSSDTAKKLDVENVTNVSLNEYGTPFLDSIFEDIKTRAKYENLVYVNCDIIFLDNFRDTINLIYKKFANQNILVGGRRIDLDIKCEIDYGDELWQEKIKNRIKNEGKVHGYSGIDYFVFNKSLPVKLKHFVVGRPGWDNWFIYSAILNKIKVIDCTQNITALHQNHQRAYNGVDNDSKSNMKLIGSYSSLATLFNADYVMKNNQVKKTYLYRKIITKLALNFPSSIIWYLKRYAVQKYMELNA